MAFDYAQFFREEEEQVDEYSEKQYQEFFQIIRINLIIVLLVFLLCLISNYIIAKYKNVDLNAEVPSSPQDRVAYWVSLKLCVFGLAIAIGIGLLLPVTIISNEIMLHYSADQYPSLVWLNDELIQQIWNFIFIFSNFCFILIPFSYFFSESTGYSEFPDNFCSRMIQAVLETMITLIIISSCIFIGFYSIFPVPYEYLYFEPILIWINFPFLYSCMSFAGAILLLVCIPKGILNLVIHLDEYMTRPYLVNRAGDQYALASIQETVLLSRRQMLLRYQSQYGSKAELAFKLDKSDPMINDPDSLSAELAENLNQITQERKVLEQKLNLGWFRSKVPWVLYPLAMFMLIATTAFTCAIVLFNLLISLLNLNHHSARPFVLGIESLSKIGVFGACVQTLLILYVWCASVVGLYSLPILGRLRPHAGRTPFFKIMLNCLVILILTSALPLFTRTVGITNFDLFGSFGQVDWPRNYYLLLVYNCVFLVSLALCLCHKIVINLSKTFLAWIVSLVQGLCDLYYWSKQFCFMLWLAIDRWYRERVATVCHRFTQIVGWFSCKAPIAAGQDDSANLVDRETEGEPPPAQKPPSLSTEQPVLSKMFTLLWSKLCSRFAWSSRPSVVVVPVSPINGVRSK